MRTYNSQSPQKFKAQIELIVPSTRDKVGLSNLKHLRALYQIQFQGDLNQNYIVTKPKLQLKCHESANAKSRARTSKQMKTFHEQNTK